MSSNDSDYDDEEENSIDAVQELIDSICETCHERGLVFANDDLWNDFAEEVERLMDKYFY